MDRRLLRLGPVRRYALTLAGSAVVAAVLVVGQAVTLAALLTGPFDAPAVVRCLTFVVLRGAHTAISSAIAGRATARLKAHLRGELLAAATARGPGWLAGQRAGELATLAGRGVDGLDGYLGAYLPQVFLAVTVPVAALIWLAVTDVTSAVVVAVTLPLIPLFGALVGRQTGARTRHQWRLLQRLGGHFLDTVTGLPTLRTFGRERSQVRRVRAAAEAYRAASMGTLRLAFLSALVLELVATVSVALVAVPVGLRLLDGQLTLGAALVVLLLAPEAYLPLRALGTKFHASQEGLAATTELFKVLPPPASAPAFGAPAPALAAPAPPPPPPPSVPPSACAPVFAVVRSAEEGSLPEAGGTPPDISHSGEISDSSGRPGARAAGRVPSAAVRVVFERVDVRYGDHVALHDVTLDVGAGERVALVGPSGAGKSTMLALLLGFVTPGAGRVLVDGADLRDLDLEAWRRRLAWLPQRPHLFAGSAADNIRLGAEATAAQVEAAARAASADGFIRALPDGYHCDLTRRGLSSGQRQRLAMARVWLRRDAGLLLLDEPTARLDAESEAAVLTAAAALAEGRTALFVAHRPALLSIATRVFEMTAPEPLHVAVAA